MTTDHFDDLQAGIGFLKGLSGVDPARIVVAGHSFGGQLALLAAEADSTLNAVLDFAGAANSWAGSAELRSRLLHAVASTIVPIFIAHAANDFSTEPGTALAAEMAQRGRVHELVIYPPVGESTSDGHDLIFLAPELWAPDVFGFLEKYSS
jgi:dienelactone hydrolase